MPVTDLLSRIPFSPARETAVRPAAPAEAAGGEWDAFSAPAEFRPPGAFRPPPRVRRTPLPAWVVLALGSAALSAIGLLALFVLRPFDARPDVAAVAVAVAPADSALASPASAAETVVGADSTPVPVDAIARLEAASNEPLHGELSQLLAAIQVGFGKQSAQIDPALRPYTVRMASRFEWNPDTFRVAVASPSPELAAARVATLRRVFSDAVAADRLQIEPATGPDALTLASR